jgi:hypothetical protein
MFSSEGRLIEQLLVPSVHQVARVLLSPRSYDKKIEQALHHLSIQSYGFLSRIFTPVILVVSWPKLKNTKNICLHIIQSVISVSLVKFSPIVSCLFGC